MRLELATDRTVPISGQRAAWHLALAIGLGIALGLASGLGNALPSPLAWLVTAGSPWIALAFVVGALVCRPWRGALYGALALTAAMTSYGAYLRLNGGAGLDFVRRVIVPWLALALVVGPLFGFAGGLWRTGSGWRRSAAVALLSGLLAAEAVFLLHRGYETVMPNVVFGFQLVCALLLPWLLLRARRDAARTVALGCAIFVLGLGAESLVLGTLNVISSI